ncbi:hypothetical protein F0562_024118 [Nyssa sinensis]|uniref:Uncharacterized protein n=1 Tax=Nyssa sinensis TaxID=561372 RepID=A0A5J5BK10_9ASTE|nr:hypothetical protein F0562_024118 [Nyssa sinensis]
MTTELDRASMIRDDASNCGTEIGLERTGEATTGYWAEALELRNYGSMFGEEEGGRAAAAMRQQQGERTVLSNREVVDPYGWATRMIEELICNLGAAVSVGFVVGWVVFGDRAIVEILLSGFHGSITNIFESNAAVSQTIALGIIATVQMRIDEVNGVLVEEVMTRV